MPPEKYNRFDAYKVLLHPEKLTDIVAGNVPAPVEWVIYPSNVCGYQCAHCIMAKEQVDHKNTLSREAMLKIPQDALDNGIQCVIFSGGGDPLLNPMTLEIAKRLKKAGILVGLNNQGYLLSDPTPFNFVRYSVDAATPEMYKQIHRVDGWDRVNRNIANHAKLRLRGEKIELGLAFLITPWNWEEVEAFVEWGQQFNPDFIHIRPAYLDADYLDKQYPGGGALLKEKIIPSLRELSAKLSGKNNNVYFRVDKFEGFWTPKLYQKCRATPLMAVTSGDGAFLICQDRGISVEENYLRWGNYNTQSFQDIWFGQEHKDIIEKIDLPKCPRCVENSYNEIIEHVVMGDKLRGALL